MIFPRQKAALSLSAFVHTAIVNDEREEREQIWGHSCGPQRFLRYGDAWALNKKEKNSGDTVEIEHISY